MRINSVGIIPAGRRIIEVAHGGETKYEQDDGFAEAPRRI